MVISDTIYWILFAIPSILIASTLHEYAHGLAAYKLGDPTAKAAGRLTLNPLAHIDPIGALSMIFFRFGWSKPVPINEYNFKKGELGTAITALAGPFSNFLLASLCGLANWIFNVDTGSIGGLFLLTFTTINLALAFFNLIPIPPLDGHKIVRAILPIKLRYYWQQMERFQIIFLVILILPITPSGSIASIFMSFFISKSLLLLGFL
ncbi:MAG: site-2 protease family protein [Candidatus Dojkabacteria bacterium]|jgi:Zn-dependent protease|nr:site-2 protease family protein [Candidatus Dojkabacteria bacterium]MDD4560833.1 site-2 protease family protein [Candidatus Dojkabacteria bacterium]NLB11770.1 site-2 protease family protein [Candidatus Dojkabacteria bacterium]